MGPAARDRGAGAETPANLVEHKDDERERILAALRECGWNRLRAARVVGIPRRTFYRRLKEYGIQ